jgi:acyl-CoA thioesterase YciA
VAIDAMAFHHPVYVGDIVSCHAQLLKIGRTSMRIAIEAWAQRHKGGEHVRVTQGTFTYVAIDDQGRPHPVQRT